MAVVVRVTGYPPAGGATVEDRAALGAALAREVAGRAWSGQGPAEVQDGTAGVVVEVRVAPQRSEVIWREVLQVAAIGLALSAERPDWVFGVTDEIGLLRGALDGPLWWLDGHAVRLEGDVPTGAAWLAAGRDARIRELLGLSGASPEASPAPMEPVQEWIWRAPEAPDPRTAELRGIVLRRYGRDTSGQVRLSAEAEVLAPDDGPTDVLLLDVLALDGDGQPLVELALEGEALQPGEQRRVTGEAVARFDGERRIEGARVWFRRVRREAVPCPMRTALSPPGPDGARTLTVWAEHDNPGGAAAAWLDVLWELSDRSPALQESWTLPVLVSGPQLLTLRVPYVLPPRAAGARPRATLVVSQVQAVGPIPLGARGAAEPELGRIVTADEVLARAAARVREELSAVDLTGFRRVEPPTPAAPADPTPREVPGREAPARPIRSPARGPGRLSRPVRDEPTWDDAEGDAPAGAEPGVWQLVADGRIDEAVAAVAPVGLDAEGRQRVAALLDGAPDDVVAGVRLAVAGRWAGVATRLRRLLEQDDPVVRRVVVEALGQLAGPSIVPTLRRLMEDGDGDVAAAARAAVERLLDRPQGPTRSTGS